MKKAQSTLYIILAILLIIMLAFLLIKWKKEDIKLIEQKEKDSKQFLNEIDTFQNYFDECATLTIKEANVKFGIYLTSQKEYESFVSYKIKLCMSDLLILLKDRGYKIVEEETSTNVEINDKNLLITIIYPIQLSKEDQKFTFEDYSIKFEKHNIIKLNKVGDQGLISSSDRNLNIELQDIEFVDYMGNEINEINLLVVDSRYFEKEDLENYLTYGILPLNVYASDPFELRFDLKSMGFDEAEYNNLAIAWWVIGTNQWGTLESRIEEGVLVASTRYTTFFGIAKKQEINGFSNIEPPINNGMQSDLLLNSNALIPKINYDISSFSKNTNVYSGEANKIFNTIKQEIYEEYSIPEKGYVLTTNQDCVNNFISSGALCATGSSTGCGILGVHCKSSVLSLSEEDINTLFRHEITHSIQQIKEGCPVGDVARSEWGAEYMSDSEYYQFVLDGEGVKAAQISSVMLESCSESELVQVAICEPNANDLWQKCLLSKHTISWT